MLEGGKERKGRKGRKDRQDEKENKSYFITLSRFL